MQKCKMNGTLSHSTKAAYRYRMYAAKANGNIYAVINELYILHADR